MENIEKLKNLQMLLRRLGKGDKTIIETPDGRYIAKEYQNGIGTPKGSVERTIESRLQFEIYGEYPLSEGNQFDYQYNIKKAFNI